MILRAIGQTIVLDDADVENSVPKDTGSRVTYHLVVGVDDLDIPVQTPEYFFRQIQLKIEERVVVERVMMRNNPALNRCQFC